MHNMSRMHRFSRRGLLLLGSSVIGSNYRTGQRSNRQQSLGATQLPNAPPADHHPPQMTEQPNTTETDHVESDDDQESAPFAADLRLACYHLTVDTPVYDRVVVEWSDGTTKTFDGSFRGRRLFGYVGSGDLIEEPDTHTVRSFHGPIKRATVSHGTEKLTTDTQTSKCAVEAVTFTADTATVTGTPDDITATFGDGSIKQWDPPATGTTTFGSPGRKLTELFVADHELRITNPTAVQSAAGGQEGLRPVATRFEDNSIIIGAEEFAVGTDFGGVEIVFTDGSIQTVGNPNGASQFELPATITVADEHTGKTIEAVHIGRQNGEIWFRLCNREHPHLT